MRRLCLQEHCTWKAGRTILRPYTWKSAISACEDQRQQILKEWRVIGIAVRWFVVKIVYFCPILGAELLTEFQQLKSPEKQHLLCAASQLWHYQQRFRETSGSRVLLLVIKTLIFFQSYWVLPDLSFTQIWHAFWWRMLEYTLKVPEILDNNASPCPPYCLPSFPPPSEVPWQIGRYTLCNFL